MAKQKSPRKQLRKQKPLINPYYFTLSKGLNESKLTQKELDVAEMPILLYSAIIQSGKSANAAEGSITKHIVMLQVFASQIKNRPLYDLTVKAVDHWFRALSLSESRKTPLDLSTSAKRLVHRCICEWRKALRAMDVKTFIAVCDRWEKLAIAYNLPEMDKAA